MNEEINIENIRECVLNKRIYWTKHCLNRMNQRNILISEVKYAINNGTIIEYYRNDYPYPSCLILGRKQDNTIIHIVCGIGKKEIAMITAYHPDKDKWENDTRNGGSNNELL